MWSRDAVSLIHASMALRSIKNHCKSLFYDCSHLQNGAARGGSSILCNTGLSMRLCGNISEEESTGGGSILRVVCSREFTAGDGAESSQACEYGIRFTVHITPTCSLKSLQKVYIIDQAAIEWCLRCGRPECEAAQYPHGLDDNADQDLLDGWWRGTRRRYIILWPWPAGKIWRM